MWTCSRVSQGVRCGHVNDGRVTYCRGCGKARQKRKPPAHLAALELSYEWYVEFNGGPDCGVCGAESAEGRTNDRDHDHRRGFPRGLACPRCNRTLDRATRFIPTGQEAWWMTRAGLYLTRAEDVYLARKRVERVA